MSPYSAKGKLTDPIMAASPAILERLRGIPGVEAVASASMGPMMGESFRKVELANGRQVPEGGGRRSATVMNVSRDFFKAAGVRVVAGRTFDREDGSGIVVSETMAKAYCRE